MICPGCGKEPLTRNRFIWKPQALTLTCSHCGAELKMSPATLCLALLLVLSATLVLALLGFSLLASGAIPRSFWQKPSAAAILVAVAGVVLGSVGLAYLVRLVLWTRTYVKKAGGR